MRPIIAFVLVFVIAAPAQASPWDWIGKHKRFLLMEGTALATTGFHAYGLHRCRIHGVERCEEHYGAAWGAFGFEAGLTTVAMPAAAEGCWHELDPSAGSGAGSKLCYALGYGGSVAQFGQGWHELYVGETSNAQKPDLSGLVILHP